MKNPIKKGCFITIEGIEGAGKSTQVAFIKNWLAAQGIAVVLTREPGGTVFAEQIRDLLLTNTTEVVHPDTELLLYFASRAQHLQQLILPALKAGSWVICDRFTDATYAYQGGGRGEALGKIAQLEQLVQGDLRPDYTLLFDLPVAVGFERICACRGLDRIEIEERSFFEKVRQNYLTRAQQEAQRFRVINAEAPLLDVQQQVERVLEEIVAVEVSC